MKFYKIEIDFDRNDWERLYKLQSAKRNDQTNDEHSFFIYRKSTGDSFAVPDLT